MRPAGTAEVLPSIAHMTDRKTRLDGVAVASLLPCSALWGLNHVATKLTLQDVPPLGEALTLRLEVACATVVLGIALVNRPARPA